MTTKPIINRNPNKANAAGTKPKPKTARIQRPCMTQPIKQMLSVTANDYNNCRPKGVNNWDGILSAHSKKSLVSSTYEGSSPRKHEIDPISMYLFDPQHVLKFLVGELKTKLKLSLPGDKNVQKILLEIQQTMKRLGGMSSKTPFTASSSNLMQEIEETSIKRYNSVASQRDKFPYQLLLQQQEKAIQTDDNLTGIANRLSMETQIKKSHEKLQENCDALEKACAALQEEKYSIHTELCKCRDEIAMLKTEVAHLQNEVKEANTREKCTTQELEEQCKRLQDELKSLQDFLSKQKDELKAVESLSGKLKESSEKISLLEKSKMENDKILVFAKLEKEKLMVLQKFRENQMESLQKDITEVYKLIKEQLAGIQYSIENVVYKEKNRKNSSSLTDRRRKNSERIKKKSSSSTPLPPPKSSTILSSIDIATDKATYGGDGYDTQLMTTSNSENNFRRTIETFPNISKMRKTHQIQNEEKTLESATVGPPPPDPDGAYDLFTRESITLKNHRYPDDSKGKKRHSASSSPPPPPPGTRPSLVTNLGNTSERCLSKNSIEKSHHHHHQEKLPSENVVIQYQYHGGKPENSSRVDKLHCLPGGAAGGDTNKNDKKSKKTNNTGFKGTELSTGKTTKSVRSNFNEFKAFLDDVMPPSPPEFNNNYYQLNSSTTDES